MSEPSSNQSISSPEDSPASQSAWLDGDEEPPTSDGSGLSSLDSFAFYDPDTRWWRTCQGFLLGEAWPRYSETWPRSGSMRNGTASPLRPSVPRISVTGSSSLPTPAAISYGYNQGGASPEGKLRPTAGRLNLQSQHHSGTTLTDAIRLWPTPQARDHRTGQASRNGRVHSPATLNDRVAMWPTPSATDHKGSSAPGQRRGQLAEAVRWPSPRASDAGTDRGSSAGWGLRSEVGGLLNPTWVEWLMGFPLGWTALEPSETPSSRRLRRRSGG
jgi:hypothetical protein